MKNLFKTEIEFLEFDAKDVIATSGDTYTFSSEDPENTTDNAHDSADYSAGAYSLWNINQ